MTVLVKFVSAYIYGCYVLSTPCLYHLSTFVLTLLLVWKCIPLNLLVAFVSHFHWSLSLNIAFSEVRNQRGGDNSLWNRPSSTCYHMIVYIGCLVISLLWFKPHNRHSAYSYQVNEWMNKWRKKTKIMVVWLLPPNVFWSIYYNSNVG